MREVVGNEIDVNDLFNLPSKPEGVQNNKNNNIPVEYDYPSSEGNDQEEEGIYEYIDEFSKPVLFFKKHYSKILAVSFLASLVVISIIVFLIVLPVSHHPGTATTTKVSPDTTPTYTTATTTKVQTTTESVPEDQKCAKRIIGYFTDSPNLEITKNQLKNLTHAVLTSDFLTDFGAIEYKDSLVKNRLGSMKKLSGDDTKVMISLGGNRFFSELLQTEKSRKLLAYNIVDFLVIAQIDGVDLFWKWPTASDNENYSEFVKILRKTMLAKNSNLILSVTSAPAGIPGYWPVGFNLEEMINNVDFINVFSTDFYGPWSEKTGPAAPLYYGVHPRENYTVDYTMQYYVCKLKDPKKLNVVVPLDVRIWEYVGDALEPTKCEVFRRAELKSGKVQGTIWTSRRQAEEAGIKLLKASWDESTKSSYVWNRDEKWISTFEDKKSLDAKLDYVKAKNLGGIWIRSVDMDDGSVNLLDSIDFGGYCASESDNAVKYQC
ncbi:unnamed protein product [Caenorhabditis nigoni]